MQDSSRHREYGDRAVDFGVYLLNGRRSAALARQSMEVESMQKTQECLVARYPVSRCPRAHSPSGVRSASKRTQPTELEGAFSVRSRARRSSLLCRRTALRVHWAGARKRGYGSCESRGAGFRRLWSGCQTREAPGDLRAGRLRELSRRRRVGRQHAGQDQRRQRHAPPLRDSSRPAQCRHRLREECDDRVVQDSSRAGRLVRPAARCSRHHRPPDEPDDPQLRHRPDFGRLHSVRSRPRPLGPGADRELHACGPAPCRPTRPDFKRENGRARTRSTPSRRSRIRAAGSRSATA